MVLDIKLELASNKPMRLSNTYVVECILQSVPFEYLLTIALVLDVWLVVAVRLNLNGLYMLVCQQVKLSIVPS